MSLQLVIPWRVALQPYAVGRPNAEGARCATEEQCDLCPLVQENPDEEASWGNKKRASDGKGTGPQGEVLRPPMHIYHMKHEDAKAIIAYLNSLPCAARRE
jgi:hypothetical protein